MSTIEESIILPERLGPPPRDTRRGRYVYLVTCIVIGLISLFTQQWYLILLGVIVAVVLGPLGFARYDYEPGYLVPIRLIRDALHKRRNGRFYQNDEEELSLESSSGLFAKATPINIHMTTFPIELSSSGVGGREGDDEAFQPDSIAVLHDPTLKRDTAIITYDSRHSRAANGPLRMASDFIFADAIVEPLFSSPNRGTITHGIRNRPLNMNRYFTATAPRLGDAVQEGLGTLAGVDTSEDFVPKTADERLAVMEAQKAEMIAERSHDPINWISYSVTRPKSWPRGDLSDQVEEYDLVRSVLVRLARQAEESLEAAGALNPVALDIWGMSRFARGTWDMNISEWAHAMDELLNEPDADPFTDPRCWPWPRRQIITKADRHDLPYLEIDGSLHRVWRQVERDSREIYPDTFSPIYENADIGIASETGLVVALVGDVFSADLASKSLDTTIMFQQLLGDLGKDPGRRMSDRETRILTRGIELQRQIDNGGKNGYFNNLYCVTSAANSPFTLEEVDDALLRHARQVGITLECIESPTIALKAFKVATLGVPSL